MSDAEAADRAILASIAAEGVDMGQPLAIEFHVAAPDDPTGRRVEATLQQAGYAAEFDHDEGEPDFDPDEDDAEEFGPSWTVYVQLDLVPTVENLRAAAAKLAAIVEPLGAEVDGWGAEV